LPYLKTPNLQQVHNMHQFLKIIAIIIAIVYFNSCEYIEPEQCK